MKVYKLIPSHNILTSFSRKEAEMLINIIEIAPDACSNYGVHLTTPDKKRLQAIKRSLVKIVTANKK